MDIRGYIKWGCLGFGGEKSGIEREKRIEREGYKGI